MLRPCSLDVSTSMTYIPGTGPQPLFPAAHLVLCPTVCPVSALETRLSLHTAHPGCDRNTYSLAMMREKCGASNLAVDLLTEVASELKVSDESEEAGTVFRFDGKGGALVPPSLLAHDLGPEFTISTWLRHGRKKGKQTKEEILCLADDHRKNRHHTSLFVRNCKLVRSLISSSSLFCHCLPAFSSSLYFERNQAIRFPLSSTILNGKVSDKYLQK